MGTILQALRSGVKRLPPLHRLLSERAMLRAELEGMRRPWPPGHFYSPIPVVSEALAYAERRLPILDLDLNQPGQLALLAALAPYQADLPFGDVAGGGPRFYYRNDYFSYMDAIVLHSLLRHRPPARLVEVGSGFSSCVVLDTNELFLGNRIDCTFVEPYPERFRSLLRAEDRPRLIERKVQDVPPDVFDVLEAGDVLFIDTSHVSKAGSDVNHLLFTVLPRLRAGVVIHIHDVFYPFEYPRAWVQEGVAWNELFTLRAFLQNNRDYEILLFNSFLLAEHPGRVLSALPAMGVDGPDGRVLRGGDEGSLWLRKL